MDAPEPTDVDAEDPATGPPEIDPVYEENLREHAEGKQFVGATREKIHINVRELGEKLGLTSEQIEEFLRKFEDS